MLRHLAAATGKGAALAALALLSSLAGSLAAAPEAAAADLPLEVIRLRYRTVEQVLPVIQPLVPKPGTVSGVQNDLIIRTTPGNLAEVRRVLEAIDRMPRRLLITVRQDADTARVRERADMARIYGTESADSDRSTQQVQVLEGSDAHIRIGQSIPVPSRSTVRRTINGRLVEQTQDSIEYRDVLAGFSVRPQLAGDIVTLAISPQRDTPGTQGRGSIDIQRLSTTVSGRLGEWIELGGVLSSQSFEGAGTVYRSGSAATTDRRVLLKVDEVR